MIVCNKSKLYICKIAYIFLLNIVNIMKRNGTYVK